MVDAFRIHLCALFRVVLKRWTALKQFFELERGTVHRCTETP